jgi:hypothetical protein
MMSEYEVTMPGDSMAEFNVKFIGPKESASSIHPYPSHGPI